MAQCISGILWRPIPLLLLCAVSTLFAAAKDEVRIAVVTKTPTYCTGDEVHLVSASSKAVIVFVRRTSNTDNQSLVTDYTVQPGEIQVIGCHSTGATTYTYTITGANYK